MSFNPSYQFDLSISFFLLSRYAFPEVVRLLEASFRYHLTKDPSLPQQTASITSQPVVAIHASSMMDNQLSEELIAISKDFLSIPFFAILPEETKCNDHVEDCCSTTTRIELIVPRSGEDQDKGVLSSSSIHDNKSKNDVSIPTTSLFFHSPNDLAKHLSTLPNVAGVTVPITQKGQQQSVAM